MHPHYFYWVWNCLPIKIRIISINHRFILIDPSHARTPTLTKHPIGLIFPPVDFLPLFQKCLFSRTLDQWSLIFFFLLIFYSYFIFFIFYFWLCWVFGSCEGFLWLRQVGATLHRGAGTALHHGAWAFHYRGPSRCGAQAPDAQAQ